MFTTTLKLTLNKRQLKVRTRRTQDWAEGSALCVPGVAVVGLCFVMNAFNTNAEHHEEDRHWDVKLKDWLVIATRKYS